MTFNYKFKRFYEIFLICVIISIRCIYFYPLNVYLVLLFTDDECWRKSLGADGIHDDVAIIRRGRLQWITTPLRRRLSPDAPRRVLTRRLRMCDVIRLTKDDVAATHSSPSSRLMMVTCFGAGWLRRPRRSRVVIFMSTMLWRRFLKYAVIEPWSLCSWRTLLKVVTEDQYHLSTFVSVKISHFYPWTTINYHKQIFSINYQRPRRDSSSLVVFNALIFLSLNCVKGLLLCMSMII